MKEWKGENEYIYVSYTGILMNGYWTKGINACGKLPTKWEMGKEEEWWKRLRGNVEHVKGVKECNCLCMHLAHSRGSLTKKCWCKALYWMRNEMRSGMIKSIKSDLGGGWRSVNIRMLFFVLSLIIHVILW